MDEFIRRAGHDLKEPVRAMLTFAGLLEQDLGPDLPAAARRDLDFIVASAKRANRLVEDLLALGRFAKVELKLERVNLAACVDSALAAMESRMQVTCGELPVVTGDAAMITRLFQHLFENAEERLSGTRTDVRVVADAGVFGVVDNGPLIRPEDLEKYFDSRAGAGLGLAICRQVAARHGGRLWVENFSGGGSAFLFTLGETPQ